MGENNKEYAYAEGGAHVPIAHALRLPEPIKKPKSEGCVPLLRSGPLAALRFGCMWKERRKKEERIMPSLVASMSALARTTCVSTHSVRTNNMSGAGTPILQ